MAQRWANVSRYGGPTSYLRRWAHVILAVGPTLAQRRRYDVGPTLAQQWAHVRPTIHFDVIWMLAQRLTTCRNIQKEKHANYCLYGAYLMPINALEPYKPLNLHLFLSLS